MVKSSCSIASEVDAGDLVCRDASRAISSIELCSSSWRRTCSSDEGFSAHALMRASAVALVAPRLATRSGGRRSCCARARPRRRRSPKRSSSRKGGGGKGGGGGLPGLTARARRLLGVVQRGDRRRRPRRRQPGQGVHGDQAERDGAVEAVRDDLDARIKATGCRNAYFRSSSPSPSSRRRPSTSRASPRVRRRHAPPAALDDRRRRQERRRARPGRRARGAADRAADVGDDDLAHVRQVDPGAPRPPAQDQPVGQRRAL